MEIIVYTRHATYQGDIHIPARGGGEGKDAESYRLQDVLNNPLLLYKPPAPRAKKLLLKDAIFIYEGAQSLASDRLSEVYVDPAHIEAVYDISEKDFQSSKADFERHLILAHHRRLELVTNSGRRISGDVNLGLRVLTNPDADKKFFAVSPARIEMLATGSEAENVKYVLVNRDYVEAFRDLESGEQENGQVPDEPSNQTQAN